MDLEEIGINAGNWVGSAQDRDYWSPCECGIEPSGFISHGVSQFYPDVRFTYFNYLFFHRRPTHKLCFLSCMPFVVNATFSTGLDVLMTKGLQETKHNL